MEEQYALGGEGRRRWEARERAIAEAEAARLEHLASVNASGQMEREAVRQQTVELHASYRQVVDEHAKEWEKVNYEMMMDRAEARSNGSQQAGRSFEYRTVYNAAASVSKPMMVATAEGGEEVEAIEEEQGEGLMAAKARRQAPAVPAVGGKERGASVPSSLSGERPTRLYPQALGPSYVPPGLNHGSFGENAGAAAAGWVIERVPSGWDASWDQDSIRDTAAHAENVEAQTSPSRDSPIKRDQAGTAVLAVAAKGRLSQRNR